MLLMRPMRKIQPRDIHARARLQHLAEDHFIDPLRLADHQRLGAGPATLGLGPLLGWDDHRLFAQEASSVLSLANSPEWLVVPVSLGLALAVGAFLGAIVVILTSHITTGAALPVFTEGADGRTAMLPRQCTEEYKLAPIRKYLRQRLGYQPRQRIPKASVTALIGVSAIRMPNASRACSIALMIAAAAGITPHSPTPLTPSGLSGEGDTWLISSIRGSSVAPAIRYSAKLVVSGCALAS